ncbi:uncharacterized protein LOC111346791, partial [Stylophora pistillata]|uniref:uncharacterized protein LOC111346791 n=1 Tax=Stylophora pistillata TaxID=50429 RepID=UPI000C054681
VDVKIVIEELKTEEMQRVPEVNIHLQESMMHHCMPSHEFAAEKMKLRSMRPVVVGIHPTRDSRSKNYVKEGETKGKSNRKTVTKECSSFPCYQSENPMAQYFDVDTKVWRCLASVARLNEITEVCRSTELIGNYLYVVAEAQQTLFALLYPNTTEVKCLVGGMEPFTLQRYKEELGKSYNRITLYLCKKTAILDALFMKSYNSGESDADLPTYEEAYCFRLQSIRYVHDYIYAIRESQPSHRFSLKTSQWQGISPFYIIGTSLNTFCSKASVVFNSCVFVLHGVDRVPRYYRGIISSYEEKPSLLVAIYPTNRIQPLGTVQDEVFHACSLIDNSWQGEEGLNFIKPLCRGEPQRREELSTFSAAVMSSRIYVIHGYRKIEKDHRNYEFWVDKPAVVHCFDPNYNVWTNITSTCLPHFESSLFVVNDRLCVAGGKICKGRGDPAPVEVYHEGTNTWSVVPQKHIPTNDSGAVEIEGRVYFIINKFPVEFHLRKCFKFT